MKIKVCGMTSAEQVDQLHGMGVTYAGFIFFPGSPRYVLNKMQTAKIRLIHTVNKVGVFVNANEEEVLRVAEDCRLHMVQLHGEESPEYCRRLAKHVPVMKAFRLIGDEKLQDMLLPYQGVCEMFLFDTKGKAYGGTGEKFNWEVLGTLEMDTPYMLSGGIGPHDAEIVRDLAGVPRMHAFSGVDINSRFELAPGEKDMKAVQAFAGQLLRNR